MPGHRSVLGSNEKRRAVCTSLSLFSLVIFAYLVGASGRPSHLAEPVLQADSDACPQGMAVAKSGRRQRRPKPVEVDDLVAMYESGMSVNELASQVKIHRTTVMADLRRRGVQTRRNWRELNEEQVLHVIELYESGLSLIELGSRFGVNAETVRQMLIGHGVPRRSPGRTRVGGEGACATATRIRATSRSSPVAHRRAR